MIYIKKKGLSDELKQKIIGIRKSEMWKRIDKDDSDAIRKVFDYEFPKGEIKELLLSEQGGLCAYCMKRIRPDSSSRIEHFIPLSTDKEKAIEAIEYSKGNVELAIDCLYNGIPKNRNNSMDCNFGDDDNDSERDEHGEDFEDISYLLKNFCIIIILLSKEKGKSIEEILGIIQKYNFRLFNFIKENEEEFNSYLSLTITDQGYELFENFKKGKETFGSFNFQYKIFDPNCNINVINNYINKNDIGNDLEDEEFELEDDKDEKDNKDLNQNEIDSLFNKVLKKILIKDNEEPIKSYNKICIPSFQYKKRNNEKENIEDKKNENLKLIEYELLDYNEEINFCIENLTNNEIKFSFPSFKKIEDNKDFKIIKNDFIIAVINPDLVLDYHLPAMNIFYINKEHWIKINN